MMGSTEDPPDGNAVAGAVYGAVIVYAVRSGSLRPLEASPLPISPCRTSYPVVATFTPKKGKEADVHVRSSSSSAPHKLFSIIARAKRAPFRFSDHATHVLRRMLSL